MASRTEGLERFRQRVLDRLPKAAKDEIKKANEKNADEFMAGIERIIPRGDPKDGHLIETLKKQNGKTETGVVVTIGGPEFPYPLHLEAGHRTASGEHVPAKPFWNPTKRVMRKRLQGRASRAMSKAVKIASEGN